MILVENLNPLLKTQSFLHRNAPSRFSLALPPIPEGTPRSIACVLSLGAALELQREVNRILLFTGAFTHQFAPLAQRRRCADRGQTLVDSLHPWCKRLVVAFRSFV